MAKNCLFGGTPSDVSGKADDGDASKVKEPSMVKMDTVPDTYGAPVRGPARPSAMQSVISAAIGATSVDSPASFNVCGPTGPPGRPSIGVAGPPSRPSVGPAGPPAVSVSGPPTKESKSGSGGDRNSAAHPPSNASGALQREGYETAKPSSSSSEEEEPVEQDKVRKYLERMRGSGSKDVVGASGKKAKKDKKQKKEKIKQIDTRPKKAPMAGPALSMTQIKEKKKQAKLEKKLAKTRKKEMEKERMLVAAERETKRIFGRKPLEISDSSEASAASVKSQASAAPSV